MTGRPKFEIFPKSESEFFWKAVEAQVKFIKNEQGEVTKAIHHQAGMKFDAPRIKEETALKLQPEILKAYAGKYDCGKGRGVLTVSLEGNRLFAQMTNQPKFEIFPKSETEFFWKIVVAQVTFVKDEAGKVTKAIHKQGGASIEASRVE